jgi:hypothetical protein
MVLQSEYPFLVLSLARTCSSSWAVRLSNRCGVRLASHFGSEVKLFGERFGLLAVKKQYAARLLKLSVSVFRKGRFGKRLEPNHA